MMNEDHLLEVNCSNNLEFASKNILPFVVFSNLTEFSNNDPISLSKSGNKQASMVPCHILVMSNELFAPIE